MKWFPRLPVRTSGSPAGQFGGSREQRPPENFKFFLQRVVGASPAKKGVRYQIEKSLTVSSPI